MNQFRHSALSANTLFHFTANVDNLLSILSREFRPRFCLEDFSVLGIDAQHQESLEWAVPMVCFCDIPLSKTLAHLSIYGDYGIGMTKAWGKQHGIAPVLYAYPQSQLSRRFRTMLTRTAKPGTTVDPGLKESLYDFGCFVKPYEGCLQRAGENPRDVRFYDEREWRFVPEMPPDFYRYGMTKAQFLDTDLRREADERLADVSRISFQPSDIKYLIVRHEDEIVPLIKKIEIIKAPFGDDDKRLLASRVISADQISSDF